GASFKRAGAPVEHGQCIECRGRADDARTLECRPDIAEAFAGTHAEHRLWRGRIRAHRAETPKKHAGACDERYDYDDAKKVSVAGGHEVLRIEFTTASTNEFASMLEPP